MLFVPASIPATEAQDPPYFGAIVELDKVVYNWTDGVWIVVTAPNFNSDPNKIDYIGDKSDSRITITSCCDKSYNGEQLDFYKLEETGVDTGVFVGHVLLTGFSYDVDGDGTDDPIMNIQSRNNVNENITGDTSGKGPWDGRMKAEPGNGITVKFSETYSGSTNTHEASATVDFWIAELSWQSYENKVGEPVTITVVDEDMNLDQYNRDSLIVDVITDADAGRYQGWSGYPLRLYETETLMKDGTSSAMQNSGIFESQLIITDCPPTDLACLQASMANVIAKVGEIITVEYTDCTLPQPYKLGECVTLASKAKVIPGNVPTPIGGGPGKGEGLLEQIMPLHERFSSVNARVLDEFGELLPTNETRYSAFHESVVSVYEVTVGQQIQIVADITNKWYKEQSFAYPVMILEQNIARQEYDEIQDLEFTEGSLDQGESASPAVSWTPSAPGSYTALLVVFDCWECDDPSLLAPLQKVDIDVLPKTVEPVTAIPEWIKNNAGWWAEGQIDDSSFLQGIQFLIKEGIMVIPPTEASGTSGSEGVPAWVKNNAGWWAEGQIDDSSFLQGIQYLVKEGIIKVG
jgi:hypothetical protein